MLRGLSNAGLGFCRVGSRVFREIWVADFAMAGWVELAQMRGYLSAGTVRGSWLCGIPPGAKVRDGVLVRSRAVVVLVRRG